MRRLDKHKETVEFSLDTAYTKKSTTHLVLDTLSLLCYYKFEREEHPNYWLRVFNLSLCVNSSSIKEKLYPMDFFKDMFQGLGNFFKDPLNLNSRDREEEHFAQQQENWKKEFALQKNQFEYQKWFDQNNVTLNLKQNMDAGINPLAAQGAGTSSVGASASPQQPSQSVGGSDMSILGDLISQLGENRREDESLKVAKDKIDKDKDTQNQIIALKRDELGLENRRTSAYEKVTQSQIQEAMARFNEIMQNLSERERAGYGRDSSKQYRLFKEILAEIKGSPQDSDFIESQQSNSENAPAKGTGVSSGSTSNGKRTSSLAQIDDAIRSTPAYQMWALQQQQHGKPIDIATFRRVASKQTLKKAGEQAYKNFGK